MSRIRRVVTGHTTQGQSIIASDAPVEGADVPGLPGVSLTKLWGADAVIAYPDNGSEPPYQAWFPPVGGVRFIEFVLPPDGTPADTSLSQTEIDEQTEQLFPGLLGHFEPDNPGMHRSATTDMLYVIAGRCILELDDGSRTELGAGDVVVQSGTMHRWSNPWEETCRIIGALVGAVQR